VFLRQYFTKSARFAVAASGYNRTASALTPLPREAAAASLPEAPRCVQGIDAAYPPLQRGKNGSRTTSPSTPALKSTTLANSQINLPLHHDGHTNIEATAALDTTFTNVYMMAEISKTTLAIVGRCSAASSAILHLR